MRTNLQRNNAAFAAQIWRRKRIKTQAFYSFPINIFRRGTMIRKAEECQVEYRERMRDGEGTVQLTNFIVSPAELNDKGRLFSRITLKPGCSIGFHIHDKDAELFYILKGTAEYNDNGTLTTVRAGDVTICPAGQGHGIANQTEEVVELVAVIVYA